MKINKKGFSLIELLIVVVIIGILLSIILISRKIAIEKERTALVKSVVVRVIPELMVCAENGGEATDKVPVAGGQICCEDITCATHQDGFTETWPSLPSGWSYKKPTGSLTENNYQFFVSNKAENITCNLATRECTNL